MEQTTKRSPITIIQIWTAVFSTLSTVMMTIVLNAVWEMKEWKGVKDETDKTQTAAIIILSTGLEKANEERKDLNNRVIRLEAKKPDDESPSPKP